MGLPLTAADDGESALVFVRPHLFEIELQASGDDHFRAAVKHINAAGPLVKVDLESEWGDPVNVELSHGRYRTLGLKKGDDVFVRPRERKIYVESEQGFRHYGANI
jgi:sulfate transport system ATP-binding protein